MVELADTLVLGTSARAWGFKSLWAHHKRNVILLSIVSFFVKKRDLNTKG